MLNEQKQSTDADLSLSAMREAASVVTNAKIKLAELKSEIGGNADGKELFFQRLQKNFPDTSTDILSSTIEGELRALEESGIGLEGILEDPEILVQFNETLSRRVAEIDERDIERDINSISSRILQLRKEGVSLQKTLATLRLEFEGRIDEETDTVLAQFEALLSPELIPDEKERAAVETLFINQGITEFTPVVFSGFLTTIYEQPNEVISAETKARIKERFRPKQRIETPGALRKEAFRQNDQGEYRYNSPENALLMDNGMNAYVDSYGQLTVAFPPRQGQSEIEWIEIKILKNWTSEGSAKRLNYCLLHRDIFHHFDGLTGVFGGRHIIDDWPEENRMEAVEDSARFLRCLIGRREPNHMLQLEDMQLLTPALRALANPKNLSKTENMNDFKELGIYDGNQFDWDRLKLVGQILRRNRSFQTQALKDPVAPFLLLKQELVKIDKR